MELNEEKAEIVNTDGELSDIIVSVVDSEEKQAKTVPCGNCTKCKCKSS